ncbi:MAG: tetratricopeptide repeat protein [Candidatus Melainabacteria bacterium]|nr:tetratricopeptide repeat protein [Candidatus Melainabacteria bacterium]
MRPNSRKLEGATISALSCLIVLATTLTGCGPEKKIDQVNPDQVFSDGFTKGDPDLTVTFPEADLEKAKELHKQKKLQTAEKILMGKLEDARVAGKGTTQLGQYLTRLNNVLFDEGKDVQALKYGEVAQAIFYQQPIAKRPIAPWFVNLHSYLGMSYERLGKYKDAEKQFQSAIRIATNAPRAEVTDAWMNLLYQRLAACFDAQKKPDQAKKVRESLKNLKRG